MHIQLIGLLSYSLWKVSLCCGLGHLGKGVPCYWWHKCSGTVKPKFNPDFFWFQQFLFTWKASWGGQLNLKKKKKTQHSPKHQMGIQWRLQDHHQTENVLDAWQSVASCGLAFTRTHETTIWMILVIRDWGWAQKPKNNAVTATKEL